MSDDNFHSETLSGGATRVTFGAPAADAAPMSTPPATRVGGTSMRWTAGGAFEQAGVTRHVHNPAGEIGGSIMATRQHLNGHTTVCYEPGNEGTRVQLAFALKEGLVREVAPGVYQDSRQSQAVQLPGQQLAQPAQLPGQQGPAEAHQAQDQAADLQGVFNAEEDAAWQAEFADVPEHAFNAAAAGAVVAVTLGRDLSTAAASLARDTGMELAKAVEKVENGVWAQRQIVDRALSKVGMQPDQLEAFYEAAQQNPNKLQSAIHYLLHGRDVSQFQQLGREWLAKTARTSGGRG